MPPPPDVDPRALARELADFDARFVALAHAAPQLVLDLFAERSCHIECLPRRVPGVALETDVVVRAGAADVPDDMPRIRHVEWQTRADPRMDARMVRYGVALHLEHQLPVQSLVVQASGRRARGSGSGGLQSLSADGTEVAIAFDTLVLRATPWRRLIDPERPALAVLVPACRFGHERPALEASLQVLARHFARESPAYSLGLALHLRLAELRSVTRQEWIMTAQTEGIELPEDLNWHEPGLVRDIVLLHRRKFEEGEREGRRLGVEQGRREGVEQGRREGVELGRRLALLDVAANVASDAELAELHALDRIDDLAAAVKALLAR